MKIANLIGQRNNYLSLKFKVLFAAVLSFLYTSILAFIIYGSLNYPLNHLVYDLIYALIYFLLLHEGYRFLLKWQEKTLPFFNNLTIKYLIGLLVFLIFGLCLVFLVGIFPFIYIFQMEPIGEMEWSSEIRLNIAINLLFSGVYYSFLTGFNALKNYHQATIHSEVLQKEIAQAQYEGLKNQVNPHFLFNSLNVLSSLVHIDSNLSEKFIDQLAKSYRYVLEQRDQELVTLKTEIDFIHSFTFLLKIRFEEKLKVNITIPAEKLSYFIPPLTLQLLIENTVKHNILSTEKPLTVDILVDEDDYLIVKNNIQLRAQEFASTGVGLKNITSRFSYFTTKKVNFELTETSYIAKVPLLN